MRNSGLSKYLTDTFLSSGALLRTAAVLLLTAGFAYINRAYLVTDMYEVGDFAANSLLIQHAKHLELLVGNYSRVGFNHPGPAILYVLALGEWLFFDCLGWVKAPFAGQMVAEGAYSAFWIVMLAVLFTRLFRSIAVASVALLLTLVATVYFDPAIVTGLWFPHLYYFPFATFTLALILVIAGRGESLVILALSCGFLIHGHVSFVEICGVMLAGGLWVNSRLAAQSSATARILSKPFLADFRAQLYMAGLLFIAFFTPLLLQTIRTFPGPVAQYLSFGAGNRHHSLMNALQFAADYWHVGITPILSAVLALLFFARDGNTAANHLVANHARAAAATFLLATLALTLYAKYGIDDLNFNYIGIFYYAVPALALALMLASFLARRSGIIKALVAVLVIAVALPYTVRQVAKPLGYASNYHDARIPGYFERVQSLSNETIVLDLDNSQDWGPIWSTLLGVEIYSARHHRSAPLFCISRNWHISFSAEAKCTAQQIQNGNRYIVSTSAKLAETLQQSVIDLDNIHFYKFKPAAITLGQWFNVIDYPEIYSTTILNNGWTPPNGGFIWSEGKEAALSFIVGTQPLPTRIKLDLLAFLPKSDSTQTVDVTINGIDIGSIHFDQQNNRAVREFEIKRGSIGANGLLSVQFHIHTLRSPQAAGMGNDPRLLGIAFYGFAVSE